MLSKLFKKVPAGIIVVPMFLASILNTFLTGILQLGPMTGAFTSKEGLNAIIVVTLVAVGSQLTIKRFGLAFRRGLVLFLSKFLTAIILGFLFFKFFGRDGFLGISALAFIAAISNQNNSLFIGLISDFGDEYDVASAAIMAIISVPILGIGAGKDVDCQVIVLQNMLGMYPDFKPKFVKIFANVREEMLKGLNAYHEESVNATFPSEEYSFNKKVDLSDL